MKQSDKNRIVREFCDGSRISQLAHMNYHLINRKVCTWDGIRLEIEQALREALVKQQSEPAP